MEDSMAIHVRVEESETMLSFRCLLAACVVFHGATLLSADDPEPIAASVDYETLLTLGSNVFDTDLYRYNHFQYEERVEKLTTQARELTGSSVEVMARVTRVTPVEVMVEVEDAGRMKMVLRHKTPPMFGNLGTRRYTGTPSTDRAFLLSKRVGLRIGEEIDLEMAKTLQRGDTLTIGGKIEQVPIRIKHIFEPFVAAVVTEWKVTEVTPRSDTDPTLIGGAY